MSRSARLAAAMVLLVAVLIGCGSDDGAGTTAAAPSSEPLVGSIVTLALVMLFWPVISALLRKRQSRQDGGTEVIPVK